MIQQDRVGDSQTVIVTGYWILGILKGCFKGKNGKLSEQIILSHKIDTHPSLRFHF